MEDVTKVTSSYIIGTEEFSSGRTMFHPELIQNLYLLFLLTNKHN